MGKNAQKEMLNMKLAEKIYQERRKLGLSQEQFAERMDISRQAVSKWESGQSMPDLDKIVAMSQIFGVSTDYLLKEEEADDSYMETSATETYTTFDNTEYSETIHDSVTQAPLRELDVDEVEGYQNTMFRSAKKIAFGVFMCIFGAFAGIGTEFLTVQVFSMPENDFESISLLLCIAIAISQFIPAGMATEKFEYLKKESFTLPSSLQSRIKSESDNFYRTFIAYITVGVVLILVGVIFCVSMETVSDVTGNMNWDEYIGPMILLFLVAVGTYLFVDSGMKRDVYKVLLQEEDYSVNHKERSKESAELMGLVAGVYWCVVTAGYLGYSFLTGDWGRSWVVWPVAGCLFGAIAIFITLYGGKNKENN